MFRFEKNVLSISWHLGSEKLLFEGYTSKGDENIDELLDGGETIHFILLCGAQRKTYGGL